MSMSGFLPDVFGMIGVAITVGAYLLLQMSMIQITHISYSLINALGSLLILVSLYYNWNLSSVCIEGIWFAISLFGMIRVLIRKKVKDPIQTQKD